MRYIIDRFEGDIAVCEGENKNVINIPKHKLPVNSKEGDCLIVEDGILKYNERETNIRKDRIKKKMDSLFE